MKKLFFLLSLAILLMAGIANATPVYTGSSADMYLKQNTFPGGLSEEQVFLDAALSGTVTGHVGSQTNSRLVTFSSTTDILDAANGFATIKAQDGYLNNITITAPGYYFTDLIFSVNLVPDKPPKNTDLTVTANSLGGGSDAYAGWAGQGDWVSGDNRILVLSKPGNELISVTINSLVGFQDLGGIDQLKQTEISGLTPDVVPEPSTLLLIGSGLIGLWGTRKKLRG